MDNNEFEHESTNKLDNNNVNELKQDNFDAEVNKKEVIVESLFEPTKKSNNLKPLLISIIGVLLIGLGAFSIFKFTGNGKKSPKQVFETSINNIFSEFEKIQDKSNIGNKYGVDGDFKISLTMSEDLLGEEASAQIKPILDFINNMSFKYNYKQDLDTKKIALSLTPVIKDASLLTADMIISNDKLYMASKDIYSKYIDVTNDEIKETIASINEGISSNDNYIKTIKESLTKNLKDEYFKEEDAEISINAETYKVKKITFDFKTHGAEYLKAVITSLKADTKLMDLLKSVGINLDTITDEDLAKVASKTFTEIIMYTDKKSNEILETELISAFTDYDEEGNEIQSTNKITYRKVDKNKYELSIKEGSEPAITVNITTEEGYLNLSLLGIVTIELKETTNGDKNSFSLNIKIANPMGETDMLNLKIDENYSILNDITIEEPTGAIHIDNLTDSDMSEIESNLENILIEHMDVLVELLGSINIQI